MFSRHIDVRSPLPSGEGGREEASEGGPGLQPSAVPQLPQSLLLRPLITSSPQIKPLCSIVFVVIWIVFVRAALTLHDDASEATYDIKLKVHLETETLKST